MQFDLKQVQAFRMRLAAKLLDIDEPLLMDENVVIQIEAQVVEVQMKTNRSTGAFVRTHILEVQTLSVKEKKE